MGNPDLDSLLSRRLALLDTTTSLPLLTEHLHGIEREYLRADSSDKLALTPHPRVLGSTLTHPQATTNYSEVLLELITPTGTDATDALDGLEHIHRFASPKLNDEYLWSPSIPCELPDEESVPTACYGSSLIDYLKYIYRKSLALRYGKTMQCIADTHYNFSLPGRLWPLLRQTEGSELPEHDYQSAAYITLIRNSRRYSWLLIYLFGAPPVLGAGFLRGRPSQLECLDEYVLYLSYATSLRMSDLGYWSNAQTGLTPYYNDLQSYTNSPRQAISAPYPSYEKAGTEQDGEWVQLNTNALQIESEYYSSIRPKRVTYTDKCPVQALAAHGVQYVEVRCLDINPFLPLGIDLDETRSLDAFLLLCAFSDNPLLNGECSDATDNFLTVAKEGKRPDLQLQRHGQPAESKAWTNELFERVADTVALFDRACDGEAHATALIAQRAKVVDTELTPSTQVLKVMREHGESFEASSLRQSREHVKYFRQHPLATEEQARFEKMASNPPAEQTELKHDQDGDLDTFITAHQVNILGLTSN